MSTAKWSNDTNGTKWLKLPSISESLKGTCLMIYDVCICQYCCSQTKSEMADAALKSVAWKRMQYFCFLGYSTWQAQLFVEPATIKLLFSGQKLDPNDARPPWGQSQWHQTVLPPAKMAAAKGAKHNFSTPPLSQPVHPIVIVLSP